MSAPLQAEKVMVRVVDADTVDVTFCWADGRPFANARLTGDQAERFFSLNLGMVEDRAAISAQTPLERAH